MNFENLTFKNIDLSNMYGGYNNNVYGNSCGCNNIFGGNFFGSILSGMFMGGFGNSIFGCMGGYGNMFMGGYGLGYGSPCCGDPRSALKFQLGSMLGSFVVMLGGHLINKAIEDKQTNSLDVKLENKNSEIQKELKKLGDSVTEADYKDYNAADEPDFVNKQKVITDKKTQLQASEDELESKIEALPSRTELETQRDIIKNEIGTNTATPEQSKQLKEIEKKIEELDKAKKDLESVQKEIKDNEKAQENLDKEIAKRQEEIDKVKAKITNLIKERDEIQAKITEANNERMAEKADGTALSRKDIIKAANIANDGTVTPNNKNGLDEGHVKDLVKLYRSSTSETDKKKYGNALLNIYDKGLAKISPSYKKTLESFIALVRKDLNKA